MKIAQFTTTNVDGLRLGVLREGRVIDVTSIVPDMQSAILGGTEALVKSLNSQSLPSYAEEEIQFLPPAYPSKIVAIGRNYFDHAAEGGSEPPAAPLIFTKLPNSLNAHRAPIVLPSISTQVDFEAELAVVIGRRATRVAESDALDYVFGYTLIHDVSARDLQFGDGQWVRGKSLDTFAPLGPYITTKDEIKDVQALKIEGILNGQIMQSSNTGKMIFSSCLPDSLHHAGHHSRTR
jgi:2-keto-4-pentenoate hydratase/2-oxohepta-3-ene-1,7-dioic acid hydratase in catechol pathway